VQTFFAASPAFSIRYGAHGLSSLPLRATHNSYNAGRCKLGQTNNRRVASSVGRWCIRGEVLDVSLDRVTVTDWWCRTPLFAMLASVGARTIRRCVVPPVHRRCVCLAPAVLQGGASNNSKPAGTGTTHFGFQEVDVKDKHVKVGEVFSRVASKYVGVCCRQYLVLL